MLLCDPANDPFPNPRHEIVLDVEKGITMGFRWIPPGRFRMGEREGWPLDDRSEPVHTVVISAPFWMGETPVTQAQYNAMARHCSVELAELENLRDRSQDAMVDKEDHPVEHVTWQEARVIASWLTRSGLFETDWQADLPTEAQWEYACRAGTTTECYTGDGDEALSEAAWWDEDLNGGTHPVGQKAPNAFGLHDMIGDVWEWCRDRWDRNAYKRRQDPAIDPVFVGPDGPARCVRGGAFFLSPGNCHVSFRNWWWKNSPTEFHGFRLCLNRMSSPVAGATQPSRLLDPTG